MFERKKEALEEDTIADKYNHFYNFIVRLIKNDKKANKMFSKIQALDINIGKIFSFKQYYDKDLAVTRAEIIKGVSEHDLSLIVSKMFANCFLSKSDYDEILDVVSLPVILTNKNANEADVINRLKDHPEFILFMMMQNMEVSK